MGYMEGNLGSMEYTYGGTATHYPLWKPPSGYFPRGEAPPPYEEAIAISQTETISTQCAVAAATATVNGTTSNYRNTLNMETTAMDMQSTSLAIDVSNRRSQGCLLQQQMPQQNQLPILAPSGNTQQTIPTQHHHTSASTAPVTHHHIVQPTAAGVTTTLPGVSTFHVQTHLLAATQMHHESPEPTTIISNHHQSQQQLVMAAQNCSTNTNRTINSPTTTKTSLNNIPYVGHHTLQNSCSAKQIATLAGNQLNNNSECDYKNCHFNRNFSDMSVGGNGGFTSSGNCAGRSQRFQEPLQQYVVDVEVNVCRPTTTITTTTTATTKTLTAATTSRNNGCHSLPCSVLMNVANPGTEFEVIAAEVTAAVTSPTHSSSNLNCNFSDTVNVNAIDRCIGDDMNEHQAPNILYDNANAILSNSLNHNRNIEVNNKSLEITTTKALCQATLSGYDRYHSPMTNAITVAKTPPSLSLCSSLASVTATKRYHHQHRSSTRYYTVADPLTATKDRDNQNTYNNTANYYNYTYNDDTTNANNVVNSNSYSNKSIRIENRLSSGHLHFKPQIKVTNDDNSNINNNLMKTNSISSNNNSNNNSKSINNKKPTCQCPVQHVPMSYMGTTHLTNITPNVTNNALLGVLNNKLATTAPQTTTIITISAEAATTTTTTTTTTITTITTEAAAVATASGSSQSMHLKMNSNGNNHAAIVTSTSNNKGHKFNNKFTRSVWHNNYNCDSGKQLAADDYNSISSRRCNYANGDSNDDVGAVGSEVETGSGGKIATISTGELLLGIDTTIINNSSAAAVTQQHSHNQHQHLHYGHHHHSHPHHSTTTSYNASLLPLPLLIPSCHQHQQQQKQKQHNDHSSVFERIVQAKRRSLSNHSRGGGGDNDRGRDGGERLRSSSSGGSSLSRNNFRNNDTKASYCNNKAEDDISAAYFNFQQQQQCFQRHEDGDDSGGDDHHIITAIKLNEFMSPILPNKLHKSLTNLKCATPTVLPIHKLGQQQQKIYSLTYNPLQKGVVYTLPKTVRGGAIDCNGDGDGNGDCDGVDGDIVNVCAGGCSDDNVSSVHNLPAIITTNITTTTAATVTTNVTTIKSSINIEPHISEVSISSATTTSLNASPKSTTLPKIVSNKKSTMYKTLQQLPERPATRSALNTVTASSYAVESPSSYKNMSNYSKHQQQKQRKQHQQKQQQHPVKINNMQTQTITSTLAGNLYVEDTHNCDTYIIASSSCNDNKSSSTAINQCNNNNNDNKSSSVIVNNIKKRITK